jgi:hypothetical protein
MMPIGSLIGGVLAHFSLRLPMLIGGFLATALAFASIGFFMRLSAETVRS